MAPDPTDEFDVRVRREDDGTFSAVHDSGREVGCDPDEEPCAPDEESVEDEVRETGVPGTPDDVPYSLGESRDPELWSQQHALTDEDEKEGVKVVGASEDEAERIMEAMGDDAAEPLVESPNGTSATGADSPLEPPHGGFPERE